MTFRVCNFGSKYPYFNRAYLVSSDFGCMHLYSDSISGGSSGALAPFDTSDSQKELLNFGKILIIYATLLTWEGLGTLH